VKVKEEAKVPPQQKEIVEKLDQPRKAVDPERTKFYARHLLIFA